MSAYPSEQEIIQAAAPLEWLDQRFFRQDPFRFQTASTSFHQLACQVSRELEVERNGVFCIGSSAVGYSLNPEKVREGRLKRFRRKSDLDMAVVSWRHFETAWHDLQQASQPHLEERSEEFQDALNHQRRRFFDGAILVNKLLSHLSFASHWHPAFDRISESIAVSLDMTTKVEVWLYRDYWSLRNYVARGLVGCQNIVRPGV